MALKDRVRCAGIPRYRTRTLLPDSLLRGCPLFSASLVACTPVAHFSVETYGTRVTSAILHRGAVISTIYEAAAAGYSIPVEITTRNWRGTVFRSFARFRRNTAGKVHQRLGILEGKIFAGFLKNNWLAVALDAIRAGTLASKRSALV